MQNQLHLVTNIKDSAGVEVLAALRYAESLSQAGCVVTLLSREAPDKPVHHDVGARDLDRLELQFAPRRDNLFIEFFAQCFFVKKLIQQKRIDLVHIHGMWSPFLAAGALVARERGLPLVISPHGCLEPWALAYKRPKKRLALRTYQGAILNSAALFVATADREAEGIGRLGYFQPVAVIPNGVDIGVSRHYDYLDHRDRRKRVKTILFLSRIHPVKGLLDLVEAWAVARRAGWRIVIAGGDEDGHRAQVESAIEAKGLRSDFEFVGFVGGARKQACFDEADVFVLPTYSENFGIAVAEALANELPVITTTGAPWQDLEVYRCGWWVQPGVPGLSVALRAAMDCDENELAHMGKRGRQLMLDKYSWTRIGSTALEVSEWLLNQSRPMPEAVNVP